MAKDTQLLVSVPNEKLINWLGDPLMLTTEQPDGSRVTAEARLSDIVKNLLRARDPQTGQSIVVKSLEDAEKVRVIGMALREAEDGVLRIPFGEHKWLLEKAKEIGYRYLPTDISFVIEALNNGQKSNVPTEEEK